MSDQLSFEDILLLLKRESGAYGLAAATQRARAHRDPGVHSRLDTDGLRRTRFGQRRQAFGRELEDAEPWMTVRQVKFASRTGAKGVGRCVALAWGRRGARRFVAGLDEGAARETAAASPNGFIRCRIAELAAGDRGNPAAPGAIRAAPTARP